MKKSILFVLFLSLLAACGEAEKIQWPEDNGASSDESPSSAFTDIESEDDFNDAVNRIGDAEGNDNSGAYNVELTDIIYSSDCEADFVVAADFAIDTGLSESEVEEVLENGGGDQFITMEFIQDDGTLLVEDLGDEGDFEDEITGAVYADGSFRCGETPCHIFDLFDRHSATAGKVL